MCTEISLWEISRPTQSVYHRSVRSMRCTHVLSPTAQCLPSTLGSLRCVFCERKILRTVFISPSCHAQRHLSISLLVIHGTLTQQATCGQDTHDATFGGQMARRSGDQAAKLVGQATPVSLLAIDWLHAAARSASGIFGRPDLIPIRGLWHDHIIMDI